MLISEKSKEIMDNCRFCWMCRHICPIGNVTGQERNTARARMLALSLVERGAEPLSGVADNIYECALCGACTKECVTGFDPVKTVKEVRTELAMNGETPDYIEKLINNVMEYGNVYGEKEIPKKLAEKIKELPEKADVLLFLGKDAIYKTPDKAIDAIELLKKAGLNFTVLAQEPDSGYAMDFLVGKTAETKGIMEKCAQQLDFKTVVAYDGADAKIFLREYKEWGINLKTEVKTFTSYIAQLIADGKLNPKKSDTTYTFQDSSLIARDLDETALAREIISACGGNLEMLLHGKDTMSAGNLIMNEYMPKVMREVAEARWINAKNMNVTVLVTASPAEYYMLSSVKPADIELKTIEEVVLDACRN